MTWDGVDRRDSAMNERVAVLEATITDIKADQDKILAALEGIKADMSRYKGMAGGIALVFSGIFICLEMFGGYINSHWK
jgi:hypothetical protein